LKVGYEAEDLLHSASSGDAVAHSKVITLLREVQEKGNIERAKQQENPTIFLSLFAGGPVIKRPKPLRPAPYPGAPKVLDVRPRPKEELTGTRKVPKLLAMNGYPVLRFKKPQSAYLTRILSQKMDKKVRRMANTVKLDELGPIAHGEDVWDAVLSKTAGIQYNRKEPRWAESIVTISEEIKDDIWKDYTKVKETARRMLKIVDAEAELAEKEKMEWRREKRRAKLDRRAEKREAGDGGRSPPPTNDS
jgi:cytochrome c556